MCLLVAFSICFIGCESPDPKTDAPNAKDATGVDNQVSKPDLKSAEHANRRRGKTQSPQSQNPASDVPEANDEKPEDNLNSESDDDDDSLGPSLNAPKNVPKSGSLSPAPKQGHGAASTTAASSAGSQENAFLAIRFLSWNVESDGADADVISKQLSELNKDDRYDVVGLTEVKPPDWKKFRTALGEHYRYEFSRSGRSDRLQILFNTNVFEEVRHFDLKEVNLFNRYRAPLVVQLKHLKSGQELLVMINHLARGKSEIRQQQAELLVEWARDQTLPVVAIGDYNLDYVFETKKGNPAFKKMLLDNVWEWVQPEEMIDSNWYDELGDGEDDYPGSLLDFAFVANAAKNWKKTCRVIVRDGDFPDDKSTSDHRPFELEFN